MNSHTNYFQKALLLLLLLSLHLVPLAQAQEDSNIQIHTSTKGSRSTMNINTDGESFNIEYDGDILIGADDKSISGITEGGFLKIKKTTFGNSRELLIKSSGNTLTHEYKEGGRTVPFEPAGKAWLADILPDLVRSTTIGASSRVDRYFQKGGVKGVLAEIANLKSEHTKARYASLLLKKDIKESEIPMVIEGVGEQVKSDFYRYEVFKNNSELLLNNPKNMGHFLSAIQTVNSDHYKTELVKLAFSRNLPDQFNNQALQLISTVNSDHYKSEILKRMAKNNKLNENQLEFLLSKLMPEVDSDHYRSEITASVLASQTSLSSKSIDYIINSIAQTQSDHYASESLKRLVKNQQLSGQNYETLYKVLNSLQSDHYKTEFMRMLVKDASFSKHTELFLKESQNIKSDHYRSQVLRMALENGKLSDDQKAQLARSTTSFGSDHYKTEVLMQLCKDGASNKVKTAVQESAKSINSAHYYGTVMKCVQ